MAVMKPNLVKIFRDAMDVEAADLAAFLSSNCPDPTLRLEVEELLAAVDQTGLPLALAPGALLRSTELKAVGAKHTESMFDRAGSQVGPFRLVRLLGQGGMGAVWLGVRISGFAQEVAIKWAHAEGLSAANAARFAREREVLAALSHPGIARIVDGGNEGGALWFAMEYVQGHALDDYIATHQPNLEARLRLIIALCVAVQYAHQHLVVHRDLKPSNIMVQADGAPKLLDFGVAKQLDSAIELTQSRAPMTFSYAAPEQIRGDAITTSVDVYALGVILFELLTGERPHKPKGDGSLSLLQAITDTDATAPSSVLSARTHTFSASKGSAIRSSQLKGDLDTIVLKSLSRDPARRYGSAQALSEDLNAYLQQLPIRARPESARYRLLKFVRRHQIAVALGALAITAMLGLSVYSLHQAQRASASAADSAHQADLMRIEADQANAVVGHMTAVLARAQAAGESVSTTELMAWAADTELSGRYADPAKNRALKLAVSDILMTGNDFERALSVLDTLLPQLVDAQPRERLQAYANRTRALYRLGRLPEAQESLAIARLSLPAEPTLLSAQLKIYEGEIARTLGHREQAIAAAVQATELIERASDASPSVHGMVISSAAVGLLQLGELDLAQADAERALQVWREAQVQHAASLQTAETTIANAQFLRGHVLESIKMFDAIQAKANPSESAPPRAARRTGYAKALALLQQFDAANSMVETARGEMCTATGDTSLDCISMTIAAADVAQLSTKLELGEALIERAEALLGTRDIAPIKASIARFRLRSAVLANPSETNVDALIAAIAPSNLSAMVQRNVVRTLLVLAQQLSDQNALLAGRIAAKAIAQAQSISVESGGMDGALIALWQARLANQAPAANSINELALALGDAHPWVRVWRTNPKK